jgi:hypothetical protein
MLCNSILFQAEPTKFLKPQTYLRFNPDTFLELPHRSALKPLKKN